MKLPALLSLCLLAAGCAQLQTGAESPAYAARMKEAGDAYLACVTRESEKDMKNPTGAEDIATAAHGRCWGDWETYREATNASYASNARTQEQRQFAHDKAEAHLRQFEREARRAVVDAVVARSLGGAPKP
jgi:hypothetical protein